MWLQFQIIIITLFLIDSLRLTIIESDSGTKTERSKSYDEGLDNYREENTGYVLLTQITAHCI